MCRELLFNLYQFVTQRGCISRRIFNFGNIDAQCILEPFFKGKTLNRIVEKCEIFLVIKSHD